MRGNEGQCIGESHTTIQRPLPFKADVCPSPCSHAPWSSHPRAHPVHDHLDKNDAPPPPAQLLPPQPPPHFHAPSSPVLLLTQSIIALTRLTFHSGLTKSMRSKGGCPSTLLGGHPSG